MRMKGATNIVDKWRRNRPVSFGACSKDTFYSKSNKSAATWLGDGMRGPPNPK